jgi:hypothetical protein
LAAVSRWKESKLWNSQESSGETSLGAIPSSFPGSGGSFLLTIIEHPAGRSLRYSISTGGDLLVTTTKAIKHYRRGSFMCTWHLPRPGRGWSVNISR